MREHRRPTGERRRQCEAQGHEDCADPNPQGEARTVQQVLVLDDAEGRLDLAVDRLWLGPEVQSERIVAAHLGFIINTRRPGSDPTGGDGQSRYQ